MFILDLRFVLILISVLFLSACGGGSSSSSKSNIPLTEDPTNNDDVTNQKAVVMVSYNTDLTNAQILEGANENGSVHVFFKEGSDWSTRGVSRVDFYCCKNSSSSHALIASDDTPPYGTEMDLSLYQNGNYELYIDVIFDDQSSPTPFYVNFNIDNPSPPEDPTNNLPTISGNPARTIAQYSSYSFTPVANDIDGDGLTFSIINKPSWASFNTSTGNLTGTPSNANVGTYPNITISVSDSIASAILAPFDIEVTASAVVMVSMNADLSNAKPFDGSSAEGNVYVFFQAGSDWSTRGVNRVDYYCCKNSSSSHTQLPSDSTSPYSAAIDLSQYENGNYELYIDVIFNDQAAPTPFYVYFTVINSTPPVDPINNPPTISGTPATSVYVDSTYNFTPTANDIDGDTLTFSIVNMPSWATFDTGTGNLSGTPLTANIGTYSNVIINVTDGISTKSLPSFNIEVATQPIIILGSLTLSWTAPTTYTDGTPLVNLDGYKIYYGISAGSYPNVIDITNPGITTYVIENLPTNTTYYIVITAYDTDGFESAYSSMASLFLASP